MQKRQSINLFKGRNKNIVDRFIKWALSFGRVIIILTEIIALSAFLFRFSLDRQLIDLQDKIKQQQKILEVFKSSEKKYRNLQDRLSVANLLINSTQKTDESLTTLLNLIPQDLTVTNLSINQKRVAINGITRSVASLGGFIRKLKTIPLVKNTYLERIENRISNATISFNLTVNLN